MPAQHRKQFEKQRLLEARTRSESDAFIKEIGDRWRASARRTSLAVANTPTAHKLEMLLVHDKTTQASLSAYSHAAQEHHADFRRLLRWLSDPSKYREFANWSIEYLSSNNNHLRLMLIPNDKFDKNGKTGRYLYKEKLEGGRTRRSHNDGGYQLIPDGAD